MIWSLTTTGASTYDVCRFLEDGLGAEECSGSHDDEAGRKSQSWSENVLKFHVKRQTNESRMNGLLRYDAINIGLTRVHRPTDKSTSPP